MKAQLLPKTRLRGGEKVGTALPAFGQDGSFAESERGVFEKTTGGHEL